MYTDMKIPFQGYVGGGIGQQTMAGAAMQEANRIGKIEGDKRPELAEYMERSATCLTYTEDLVQTLEKRLCLVSAPAAPSTAENCASGPAPVTHYGQQLHALIERLSVVNSTVRGMLDRLGV